MTSAAAVLVEVGRLRSLLRGLMVVVVVLWLR
jgi:hypothetical protein